jgi:hypothetical protein
MPNKVNSDLLTEFYQHMKDNGTSQNYQPLMSSELLQSSFVSVFEATYFLALLIPAAIGSSLVFTYDQCAANISYVFLPSNKSKVLLICFTITLPRKLSKYPPTHLRVGGCTAESMDRLDELLKYLKYIHRGHHDND